MKLAVQDIGSAPKEVQFTHTIHLADDLSKGESWDYRFPEPLWIRFQFRRSGSTLFFNGEVKGVVEGHCSRCLEPFRINVERPVELSLIPALEQRGEIKLNPEDLDLGFYSGGEIDLGDLAQSEIILQLPIRPLCKEECLGLCCHCGGNRNEGLCCCASPATAAPRVFPRSGE